MSSIVSYLKALTESRSQEISNRATHRNPRCMNLRKRILPLQEALVLDETISDVYMELEGLEHEFLEALTEEVYKQGVLDGIRIYKLMKSGDSNEP